MLGGYGIGAGINQFEENRSRRRAEMRSAFQEMLKQNPGASAEEISKWIEDEAGFTNYWLRGALPGKEGVQRIAERNQRQEQQLRLAEKMELLDKQLGTRQKIDEMLDKELMFAEPGDYGRIMSDVSKNLGVDNDPEMRAVLSGMAGDLDSRRKRLQHKLWVSDRDHAMAVFRQLDGSGITPSREQYEAMVGDRVPDEVYRRWEKDYDDQKKRDSRQAELQLINIQSAITTNPALVNQLAVAEDQKTRDLVKDEIRTQLRPIVPAEDLESKANELFEQAMHQATMSKKADALRKQAEGSKQIAERLKAQNEAVRGIIGIATKQLETEAPNKAQAIKNIALQYILPPQSVEVMMGILNEIPERKAKEMSGFEMESILKEKLPIIMSEQTKQPFDLVPIMDMERHAVETARKLAPSPVSAREFETSAQSFIDENWNSIESKIQSIDRMMSSASTKSEWESAAKEREKVLKDYALRTERFIRSIEETRANPMEHDHGWVDETGKAQVESAKARINRAMEIIENPPAPPPMLKEDDEETGGGYRFDSPGRNPDYRWGTGSTRDPNSPAGLASMSGKGRQGAVAQLVSQMAPQYGLDPSLVMAMIHQESSFNPMATSPKNAQGLMQLIPATAERFGVRDPYDPVENLRGGMKYFRWLLDKFDGNVALALAGYNAGEGAVMKHGGIPPYAETRDYVKRILSNYRNSQQTA